VKRFSVKLEGLLEQHLVLHAPLVREGSEIGQVLKNKIRKSKNLIYYFWLRIDSRLTRVKTQYLVSQKKNWHFSALVLNGSALASNSSFDLSQNTRILTS
jgi:hypothetical protein